jgi:hypothetical protein
MGRLPPQTNPLDSSARQLMTARSSDSILARASSPPVRPGPCGGSRPCSCNPCDSTSATLAQPVESGFANAETTLLSRSGRVPVAPRVPAAVW